MVVIEKRYRRELLGASFAYAVVLVIVLPLARRAEVLGWQFVLALVPLLPLAWMLRATVRYIRDSDEFQRRLHLEALAVSAAVVCFVSMAGGILAAANVIALDGSVLLWVFPALCFLFGVLRCQIARRYTRE